MPLSEEDLLAWAKLLKENYGILWPIDVLDTDDDTDS